MNTKLIGIKDFRNNIAGYASKAQLKKERLIVMNRNTPLFEIKPFNKDADLVKLLEEIAAAKEDVKKGKVYSQDEVIALLS